MKVFVLKIANFNEVNIETLINYISEEKRQRARKFIKTEDKVRCILGELLLRKALVENFEINNDSISFEKNQYGKPKIAKREDIYFNISHSGNYVVCAVDYNEIGVDVEEIGNSDIFGIVTSFFGEKEKEYILGKEDEVERFYEIWTLKESFVKCIGKGLSMPFNKFNICVSNLNNIKVECEEINEEFYFKEIPLQGYKLSLCYKGKNKDIDVKFINVVDIIKFYDN